LLYSICSLCNLLSSVSLDTKYKKWNQKTQENAIKGRKASMLKYFVSSKDHSFKDFAGQIDTNWWNQHNQQQNQNFSGYLRHSGMEVPVYGQLLQVEIPSSYGDHLLFESLSGFPRMMTTASSQGSKQVAFEPLKENPVARVSARLRIAPIKHMTPLWGPGKAYRISRSFKNLSETKTHHWSHIQNLRGEDFVVLTMSCHRNFYPVLYCSCVQDFNKCRTSTYVLFPRLNTKLSIQCDFLLKLVMKTMKPFNPCQC